ncbi:AbrB family transcriptional regulator [Synechococcus sp. CBW1107]|uniref:AbrB family transcriptional regulator n=1 Tax=Synechococcus sp. CBW1107 TaxID=2789857 RepID=UPI0018CEA7F4|nr:AbrB family transcriptional regulator [Synechococcus sp. CBW1107]QPN56624.1 AbrB family transcriptional regulator [Synechococcus sp. CBW1107]
MALTGADLLAKVKEMGDASKSDLVRAAGYVSTKKDGSERLNFTAFYEALLEAKGVKLVNGTGTGKRPGGRSLSYVARVQGNGNLLVGKAYTALLDIKPGDEFEIKLGKKALRLMPVGGGGEEGE